MIKSISYKGNKIGSISYKGKVVWEAKQVWKISNNGDSTILTVYDGDTITAKQGVYYNIYEDGGSITKMTSDITSSAVAYAELYSGGAVSFAKRDTTTVVHITITDSKGNTATLAFK